MSISNHSAMSETLMKPWTKSPNRAHFFVSVLRMIKVPIKLQVVRRKMAWIFKTWTLSSLTFYIYIYTFLMTDALLTLTTTRYRLLHLWDPYSSVYFCFTQPSGFSIYIWSINKFPITWTSTMMLRRQLIYRSSNNSKKDLFLELFYINTVLLI